RGLGLSSRRLHPERGVLPWICLLILEAALAYALNTALVARLSAEGAKAATFERAATNVYVLDDDDGTACHGAGCGHWVSIGCGQWVPGSAERPVTRALHDEALTASARSARRRAATRFRTDVTWEGRRRLRSRNCALVDSRAYDFPHLAQSLDVCGRVSHSARANRQVRGAKAAPHFHDFVPVV